MRDGPILRGRYEVFVFAARCWVPFGMIAGDALFVVGIASWVINR